MIRRVGVILSLASFLAWSHPLVAGSDRPIVAVFNIESKGVDLSADILDRLTDALGSMIAAQGYKIVPRSELKKRLVDEKTESQKLCYDTSCQIEMGKELAAQKSVATQLIKLGKKCKLALTLYDLKKAASEVGIYESGECDEEGIVQSLENAVQKMTGGGGAVNATTPSPHPAARQVTIPNAPVKDTTGAGLHWIYSMPAKMLFTKSEITVAQYQACMNKGGCTLPIDHTRSSCNWNQIRRDSHPINCVNFHQAEAFCIWAGGRLPSSAEWYAEASGWGTRNYPWGNEMATCEYAVMNRTGQDCANGSTWPVCSKPQGNSISGLCDLGGNVWEWNANREVRGGSWEYVNYWDMRASRRIKYTNPKKQDVDIGFRCVRSPQ